MPSLKLHARVQFCDARAANHARHPMIRSLALVLILFAPAMAQAQPAGGTASAADDAPLAARMTSAARALLDSVRGEPEFSEVLRDYSMEDELLRGLEDDERRNWTYWPTERAGLALDLMHSKHRALTHELLWTLVSTKGYHKLVNIMQLENVLAATSGTGFPRGIEDYTLTLFGEPRDDGPWAWRFEGHHISLNITVAPGEGISVTPTFMGADPAEVRFGPLAGLRVLRVEEDLGRRLVNSMSPAQRDVAVVDGDPAYNAKYGYSYAYDVPWDLMASNILKEPEQWDDWKTDIEPGGIGFADLDGGQQAVLLALLDELFSTYRPEIAESYRSSLNLEALTFTWIGGSSRNEPHYYRIQGEDFLFEYDNAQGDGNHVHEVWRSRSGDFGDDLLRRHYAAAH
jgi:hypothetical protein